MNSRVHSIICEIILSHNIEKHFFTLLISLTYVSSFFVPGEYQIAGYFRALKCKCEFIMYPIHIVYYITQNMRICIKYDEYSRC